MKVKSLLKIQFIGVLALLAAAAPLSAALITNAPLPITETVTVQPIIVSDNNGNNTATFFGNPTQQSSIEGLIDTIWAQAGIDVNFLTPNSWDNTFANWGTGGPPNNGGNTRPTFDLNTIINDGTAAGVTHADSNVINMFFVNIPTGFSKLSENSTAGLSVLGGNGVTLFTGANLLDFSLGLELIASVVAHEIGHNLGLPHIVQIENLMQAAGSANPGERLNSSQISAALASNFSTTVAVIPLPPAFALMLSGLAGLFGVARQRISTDS